MQKHARPQHIMYIDSMDWQNHRQALEDVMNQVTFFHAQTSEHEIKSFISQKKNQTEMPAYTDLNNAHSG